MKIIDNLIEARSLLSRQAGRDVFADSDREQATRRIVADVRERGDAALYDYTLEFDGVKLAGLEVDRQEIDRAYREVGKELLAALKLAASRIKAYHLEQKKALLKDSRRSRLGWLVRPLHRIGVYAPGGTAPLPSSVLMTVIPARVAGVGEIILVTPPQSSGSVSPVTLAAAKIARVDRVFSVGGAQAIAALAYGTASIPAVDKVCGPGNIYVTMAKKMVYGTVGIDGLYGPSEVIIIADDIANPAYVAADLLAQAEHGSGALSILLTTSRKLADAVNLELERQLRELPRRKIIEESLEKLGFIAVVDSVGQAIELANLFAPEHLCLAVRDAASYIEEVRNAACLFVGENALEALVDYAAGPSHVLPTGGVARFASPLNVLDFVKLISLVKTGVTDIKELGGAAATIAKAEGLDAHARAVEKRLEGNTKG
jgi:histidinol dehydrogenase